MGKTIIFEKGWSIEPQKALSQLHAGNFVEIKFPSETRYYVKTLIWDENENATSYWFELKNSWNQLRWWEVDLAIHIKHIELDKDFFVKSILNAPAKPRILDK